MLKNGGYQTFWRWFISTVPKHQFFLKINLHYYMCRHAAKEDYTFPCRHYWWGFSAPESQFLTFHNFSSKNSFYAGIHLNFPESRPIVKWAFSDPGNCNVWSVALQSYLSVAFKSKIWKSPIIYYDNRIQTSEKNAKTALAIIKFKNTSISILEWLP